MAEKSIKPLQDPRQSNQAPKMLVSGTDGKQIPVDMGRVMDNLKLHNMKLSEENAILRALLQEKGMNI